jgi:uncharacterized membrane protein
MLLLDLITLVCIGLMVGTELAVSCFINPVILQLDEAAQAEALRRFAKLLGRVMPIWYGVSLVLMIGETYLRRHATGLWLLLAAVVLWIAIIVFTIAVLVPINNRVAAVKGPMPEALRLEHRRWDTLHRWRVVLLTVAMVCLMLGILRAG